MRVLTDDFMKCFVLATRLEMLLIYQRLSFIILLGFVIGLPTDFKRKHTLSFFPLTLSILSNTRVRHKLKVLIHVIKLWNR